MTDLFGDAEPPAPVKPVRAAKPRKLTAKQLREQAPPPRLSSARVDDTLEAIRVLAAAGMLAPEDLRRHRDALHTHTPPPEVSDGLADFRRRHGHSGHPEDPDQGIETLSPHP